MTFRISHVQFYLKIVKLHDYDRVFAALQPHPDGLPFKALKEKLGIRDEASSIMLSDTLNTKRKTR